MLNNIYINDNAGNYRLYDRNTDASDTSYYDRNNEEVSPLDYVLIDVVETSSSSSSSSFA